MANDVEIVVRSTNRAGPGLAAAERQIDRVRDAASRASVSSAALAGGLDTARSEAEQTAAAASDLADDVDDTAASARRAGDAADDLGDTLADTSEQADNAGEAVTGLGDDMDDTTTQARRLDYEIGQLRASLRDLADEYERTGDRTVLDRIRETRRELSQLEQVGKLLPDVTTSVVGGITTRLGGAAGGLGPVIAAIAAPAAVALGALLGASISAAVIGGAGVGGVVGGILAARDHPQVQAAATSFGASASKTFGEAFVAFVPASIAGLREIRQQIELSEKDMTRLGNASARFVAPLAEAGGMAAREVLAGIAEAAEHAGPVVDATADGLVRLGRAVGEGIGGLADNAPEAARALSFLFGVVDLGIRATFGLVENLTRLYNVLDWGSAIVNRDISRIAALASEQDGATESSGELSAEMQRLADQFRKSGEEATTSAERMQTLHDQVMGLVDAASAARSATLTWEQGLDDLTESISENGATLDVTSEKGRANRRVLESLISAAQLAGDAARNRAAAEGASADQAALAGAKMRQTWIKDLETAARRAGLSEQAVANMVAEIKAADGLIIRTYFQDIYLKPRSSETGIGGNDFFGRATGGLVGADHATAATGGIRGGLVMVGEAGRELVELPYGSRVIPNGQTETMLAGGGGGGGRPLVLELRSGGSRLDDLVVEIIRRAVDRDGGGNVQLALGSSR